MCVDVCPYTYGFAVNMRDVSTHLNLHVCVFAGQALL